jgi:hypothetical protein
LVVWAAHAGPAILAAMKLLHACLACTLALACSHSASIRHRDGLEDDGRIVRRTPSFLVIEGDAGERQIRLDDITEIDHPGNAALVTGAFLLAYGILNIAVGAPECDRRGALFCAGVMAPALVGGSMILWGGNVWLESRRLAGDR